MFYQPATTVAFGNSIVRSIQDFFTGQTTKNSQITYSPATQPQVPVVKNLGPTVDKEVTLAEAKKIIPYPVASPSYLPEGAILNKVLLMQSGPMYRLTLQYKWQQKDLAITEQNIVGQMSMGRYVPNSKYVNGAIDALSGEPVQLAEGSFNSSQGLIGWGPIYSGRGPGPLRESSSQEQGTNENTNLISQEAAQKIATRWVDLPAGVVFQNASLSTYGMNPEQKVWNLSWGPDPEKRNPGQIMILINATVDAVTGELLGFNNSVPPGENGQAGQITREQALQIAKEFLQKIQPKYYTQVELRDEKNFI